MTFDLDTSRAGSALPYIYQQYYTTTYKVHKVAILQ